MRKLFIFILFLGAVMGVKAGEVNYAVSIIPPALLENANAVKRLEELRFTIHSLRKTSLYRRYAYTVLNEKGDKFAHVTVGYDKLNSIDYIEGTLYDAQGKKVKSLKKSDIKDYSGTSEGNLADDNRVKTHNFYYKIYPYTVEYVVAEDLAHTFGFPYWTPVSNECVSVETSKLEVICPADYQFRHKSFNYTEVPVQSTDKNTKRWLWEVKNLKALESEYASPSWEELTPAVYLAPTDFEVQGYKGNMNSWKELGDFMVALNKGRDVLPASVKAKVHELTDGLSDVREKVKVLYKYHQNNTRYISIQLGIGGWQTFDANYVAAKKYGDCKALSNFMSALLKEAGITSYYTLIRAGRGARNVLDDFSSNQFNHAILCAVDKKDTVWLECTSQTLQAGYLSSFTSDRHALLITDEGGKMVRTPKYGVNENLQIRKSTTVLDDKGHLSGVFVTNYTGLQQDRLHGIINGLSKDKVMEILKEEIDLPNYDVVKYDYQEISATIPSIIETLDIIGTDYAQITGKRLFIAPNILSKTSRKLTPNANRKYPLDLSGMEYRDVDSVIITIPTGYVPESVPKDVEISTVFGNYRCSTKISDNQIIYYRKMEQNAGQFAPAFYSELVIFYDQIYKADRNRIVFVKQ